MRIKLNNSKIVRFFNKYGREIIMLDMQFSERREKNVPINNVNVIYIYI